MNKCNRIGQCLDLNCAKCIHKWEQTQTPTKRESALSKIKNFLKGSKK